MIQAAQAMRNENRLTLRQLLSYEDALKRLMKKPAEELADGAEIEELKARMTKELRGLSWSSVFPKILEKSKELLDFELPELLARVWRKHLELQEYRDKEKHPPDETCLVPLVEHTISSDHEPSVEITLKSKLMDIPSMTVPFKILLSLTLEGVVLKIRDGKIRAFQIGTCKGSGSIGCAGLTLLAFEEKRYALPGSIDFEEGIPIVDPFNEEGTLYHSGHRKTA